MVFCSAKIKPSLILLITFAYAVTGIKTSRKLKKIEIERKYDFLAIVSGPEPQRTILEKGLIKALQEREETSLMILGKPELNYTKQLGNLTIHSHLNTKELNKAILSSDLIICRPGYSTIMDLKKLGSKAFFIPTPGQTEQEYLATIFQQKKISGNKIQKAIGE